MESEHVHSQLAHVKVAIVIVGIVFVLSMLAQKCDGGGRNGSGVSGMGRVDVTDVVEKCQSMKAKIPQSSPEKKRDYAERIRGSVWTLRRLSKDSVLWNAGKIMNDGDWQKMLRGLDEADRASSEKAAKHK
jgi:hypothetical protein